MSEAPNNEPFRTTVSFPQLVSARQSFALRASARHLAVARENSPRAETDGSPVWTTSATGSSVILRNSWTPPAKRSVA
jgi:hypothetical protein